MRKSMFEKKTEKEEVFHQACNEIDNIKGKLCRWVDELEAVGMKRKAKSLEKLIGELEHWENCK